MPSDEQTTKFGLFSGLRDAVSITNAVMILVGVVAGYSLVLLTTDAVSLPIIGSVLGLVVGGIGLAAALVAYRQAGCCGDCGAGRLVYPAVVTAPVSVGRLFIRLVDDPVEFR